MVEYNNNLMTLSGEQLENVVYRIFTAYYGFTEDQVFLTPKTGDYGVDVIATSQNEKTYAAQVKAYSKPVGLAAVQEIVAAKAMYHYDIGMVFTNNFLTKNAYRLAKANHIKVVQQPELIDILMKIN